MAASLGDAVPVAGVGAGALGVSTGGTPPADFGGDGIATGADVVALGGAKKSVLKCKMCLESFHLQCYLLTLEVSQATTL